MSAVPREVSRLVYDLAGGACEYCGRRLERRHASVDHWLPRYLGGDEALANLRCACKPCNTAKDAMHPEQWAPLAAARRARREVGLVVRLTKIELLQMCAPRWAGRREPEGSAQG